MIVQRVRDEGGDWEGWYIDGLLAMEGHSVDPVMLLRELGIAVSEVEIDFEEATELAGRCPTKFSEARNIDRRQKMRKLLDKIGGA